MRLTIRAIIVWPKRIGKKCRQVRFRDGMINVITGQSGSGKSSLIHIVDYCLGSGKCRIPVGVIRDSVDWFGVLLQLGSSQLLIGRKNPEDKEQSGDVFFIEGAEIDVESFVPEKKAHVDDMKRMLSELAGLPNVGFDPSSSSGFKGPPSFRDLAAFLFQPQHIVANPNTVFFKADTYEHREKLRTIFPLVLGAVSSEQLAAKQELFQLQTELERLQAILDRQREAVTASVAQIRAYLTRAQELGLLPPNVAFTNNQSQDELVDILRLVPQRLAEGQRPTVDVGAAEAVVLRIRTLEDQEDRLARDLSQVNRRRLQIERLKGSVEAFGNQLLNQEGRLIGVGWIAKRISNEDRCPLCSSESATAKAAAARLVELANEMQQLATSTTKANPALQRETTRLQAEAASIEVNLDNIRKEKWHLEDQSVELAERRRVEVEAFRLVGRIDEILEAYQRVSVDSDLTQGIVGLENRIATLRGVTNTALERVRLSGALQRFTQAASHYLDPLRLERGNDPVDLNVDDLMIGVIGKNGRKDALWEIGSAANWMGYHLATLLGLHEEFGGMPMSPVPTFLMIDQPSQAYFPDRWPGDDPGIGESGLSIESHDIAGVRRIFQTLDVAIRRNQQKLQIIVTDHAGEITWRGLQSINLIGNWRKGQDDFLIPRDWLDEPSATAETAKV